MDVTKPSAIAPVGQGGRQTPRHPHDDADEDSDRDDGDRLWNDDEAVEIDGFAAVMTPELQEAFEELSSQLEPLRHRLQAAEADVHHYKQLAGEHDFLSIPNRREFMRELNHVLEHMADLSTPPSLVILHVGATDAVRLRHGRAVLDQVLASVAANLGAALHPTDVLGSLGGGDFAAILLIGDPATAAGKAAVLADAVTTASYPVAGGTVPLTARVGVAVLTSNMTGAAAIAAADADLLRR